jgi:Ca-activated chloride channel family protein
MWKACLLSFFLSFSAFTQVNHDGLILYRTKADFGTVDNWTSEVDSFLVENTTSKTIYILKKQFPKGFEVSLPKKGISPNSTGYIRIIYQPKTPGKFDEELVFYHSKSKEPFIIQYKGDIKSLDPYYEMACPTFSGPQRDYSSPLTVNIIDSITGEPLTENHIEKWDGEKVKIYNTGPFDFIKFRADVGGLNLLTSHEGYQTKVINIRVYPALKSITIGLVPTDEKEPILIESKKLDLVFVNNPEIKIVESDSVSIGLETPLEEIDSVELADLPFSDAHFVPNNLVFLLDISSSMIGKDKLDYMKTITKQLLEVYRSQDKISILVYADDVDVLLEHDQISDPDSIIHIIQKLRANGSTQGGNAIRKAYELARKYKIDEGNNQVIIFTDGGFNGLGNSINSLKKFVDEQNQEEQIQFSAFTFGRNKMGKRVIHELTEAGNGSYLFVDEISVQESILLEFIKLESYKP